MTAKKAEPKAKPKAAPKESEADKQVIADEAAATKRDEKQHVADESCLPHQTQELLKAQRQQ